MTIPAFAWSYERVMSLRAYLETLAVWQAMLKAVRAIKEKAREILAFAKNALIKAARSLHGERRARGMEGRRQR